jgi:nitrate/nitrite-specific signal transduction histidine kinase
VGIGLRIMQSRARTLGGELRCRNHSERGAVVEFRYPHKLMRGRTPEAAL